MSHHLVVVASDHEAIDAHLLTERHKIVIRSGNDRDPVVVGVRHEPEALGPDLGPLDQPALAQALGGLRSCVTTLPHRSRGTRNQRPVRLMLGIGTGSTQSCRLRRSAHEEYTPCLSVLRCGMTVAMAWFVFGGPAMIAWLVIGARKQAKNNRAAQLRQYEREMARASTRERTAELLSQYSDRVVSKPCRYCSQLMVGDSCANCGAPRPVSASN